MNWKWLSVAILVCGQCFGVETLVKRDGNTKEILSATSAEVGAVVSAGANVTALGTVTTGVWNGTGVTVPYGGTGLATLTSHSLQIGNGTSAVTQLTVGGGGTLLQGVAASDPTFTITPTLGIAGTSVGKLSFANATSGTIQFLPTTGALGSAKLTLPATTGVLITDGDIGTVTNLMLAGSIDLTAKVTGILPPLNGGTGVANSKNLTVSNSLTLAGTDSTTMTFPTTSATIARTDAANTFTGASTATSWTFTTPILGTPTSGTLTNCTGLPIAGLTASTSTALGVGSIELGHATDTTIARSGAGAITVEGVQVILSGAALGTPASGTLTNCTSLPVAGITASTSTALGVGSVELGHASDTTLSRSASGVLAVEGVVVPTISSTSTWTNKRNTKRVTTLTSSATPTVNTDNTDLVTITALAANITSMTTNISGTPNEGDLLMYRIIDAGAAKTIAWGAKFAARGVALPTTTVISKYLYVGFSWNATTTTWDCIASVEE